MERDNLETLSLGELETLKIEIEDRIKIKREELERKVLSKETPVMVKQDLWNFMNLGLFNFEAGEEFERTRNIVYVGNYDGLHHAWCSSRTFVTKFFVAYLSVFCTVNEDKTYKLDEPLKELCKTEIEHYNINPNKMKFNEIPKLIGKKMWPMPKTILVNEVPQVFQYEPRWMYSEEAKTLERFFEEIRKNPSIEKWNEKMNK